MTTIYRYKGYTVVRVGPKCFYIWRNFVEARMIPAVFLGLSAQYGSETRIPVACGPSGSASSRDGCRRWINADRGLMTPVESEWIEAIGYAPFTPGALRALPLDQQRNTRGKGFVLIRFKTGKTSAFLCPSWTYGAVMRSKSKGKAYHRLIKQHPQVAVPAGLID